MSIGGVTKAALTTENVLKRISAYDIFKHYMPNNNWKVNTLTHSPFRKDENPSFIIGNRGGYLGFVDFGDGDKKGDCFDFVKRMYSMESLNDVLVMIDKDFNLGFRPVKDVVAPVIIDYKQPEESGKLYAHIQVITRKFTNEELAYWSEYFQGIDDLRREDVYSIDKVYLNRTRFILDPLELRFGYFYDGYWKIYRPFADKKKKWIPNNVPITHLEGKNDIVGAKTAVITKSKKDRMVLKKIYPHVCATQNESSACFSNENVEYIKAVSDSQILAYDSDTAGVKSSIQITQDYDFGYCNVPKIYLEEDIKDWALLGKTHGLGAIEKIFKDKGIL